MRGSVKQDSKSEKWYYEVTVGIDPETGKRKRKKKRGFASQKEAEKALTKLLAEVDSDSFLEPSKITVKDYWEEFAKIRVSQLSATAYKTEQSNFTAHMEPTMGALPLAKVTTPFLQRFVNSLTTEKGLQPATVKRIFNPLKIMFEYAVTNKLLSENPALGVIKPKLVAKGEMVVWNESQVERFLAHAEKDRLFMLFHLAVTTGLRQGELLALRWQDINLDKGVLRVRSVYTRDGELKVGGKTKSATRSVTLLKETIPLLKKHRASILSEKVAAGSEYKDNDLVICTSKGTPVRHRNVNRSFDRLMEEINTLADEIKRSTRIEVPHLPRIRFHDLRHTHATLLLLADVNPKIVAERLGHSKISVTLDIYSHVLPNMQEGVADKLSAIMFG